MPKFPAVLSAALIVGWTLAGSATDANAGKRRHGCCGPIPPSFTHKTKTVHKHITRYRDVYRTRYVERIKPIVHVTRVQPVLHVRNVTRVHTRIIGVVRPMHQYVTQMLPVRPYATSNVVYLRPHCGCGY